LLKVIFELPATFAQTKALPADHFIVGRAFGFKVTAKF